jgi:hypothetical protein
LVLRLAAAFFWLYHQRALIGRGQKNAQALAPGIRRKGKRSSANGGLKLERAVKDDQISIVASL